MTISDCVNIRKIKFCTINTKYQSLYVSRRTLCEYLTDSGDARK